jgi:NAD+ synthase (glutamine-hydrolysing)
MKTLRVAIAQINTTVGDIEQNSRKILEYAEKAKRSQTEIVVFPELAVCGYPPEDLLLKPSFISKNLKAISDIAAKIKGITAIVGFTDNDKQGLYNSAALIVDGRIKGVYHKTRLPNYGVFDEKRYFKEGRAPFVFKINGITCGISICEDLWDSEGPVKLEAKKGAKVIFAINASPYHVGKDKMRQEIITRQAKANKAFIVYANLVGGQDELVFDGQSLVIDNKGKLIAQAKAFTEDLLIVDIGQKPVLPAKVPEGPDEIYQALTLGLRDYVYKNGFKKVVIGLSGGVDSALTAAIAKDALGEGNVIGVFMPSMFTSKESRIDTLRLVKNLGIKLHEIPITNVFDAYLKDLNRVFKGYPKNIAEENIQARIRGNILMAISNKFGYLVLTTGNKSEISCGYCTLYGDMAGGFSVIKDVPKTLVYKLARFVNRDREIIPRHILTRPPTAELKPDQKDTDTLPPYPILDPIIKAYVEEDKSLEEIVKKTNQKALVSKVIRMIDSSEYKRRQASPGIKITPKAFGRDRRMPITNRFNEKDSAS